MGTYLNKHTILKNLCIAHPVVLHNAARPDGGNRKSFFRINNQDEITAAAFDGMDFPCVAYNSLAGRLKDVENALIDVRNVLRSEWWFLDFVPMGSTEGEGYTDRIELAYDTTFDIMQDFIAAMKNDYETNGACGLFEAFDLNKISYQQLDNVVDNMYGWTLTFEDESKAERITGDTIIIPGGITVTKGYEPEIIPFENEATKTVYWTSNRKQRFGSMPVVQVWLLDENNKYYLSSIQPYFDVAPPSFTQIDFNFSGNATGFILIK